MISAGVVWCLSFTPASEQGGEAAFGAQSAPNGKGLLRKPLPDAFGVGGFAAPHTVKYALPSFCHHIITLTAFTTKRETVLLL